MLEELDITSEVRSMYQEYPFPNIDYQMDYSIAILRFFSKLAPPGKRSLLDQTRIMDAGCGTGNTIIKLAKNFPQSQFTGVGLTPHSLEIARNRARSENVDNINFIEADLCKLDLKKQFKVIFSFGVLHHLSDIQTGLERVSRHLEPDGYMVLWLYGKHGRYRLNLNQQFLAILLDSIPSITDKVALTKKILENTPSKFLECHFNVPNSDIEDDWQQSLAFLLEHDSWIVDQFLHVNEKTVDMADILSLCDACDLDVVKWLNVSMRIQDYIGVNALFDTYEKLPLRQKYLALDYLLKPNYYFVILNRRGD